MIDEGSSSSILRISPIIQDISKLPHFQNIYLINNIISLMVRASHRSSESCGFDPRLGLRNRFLRMELDERSSIISTFRQVPTFAKYISHTWFSWTVTQYISLHTRIRSHSITYNIALNIFSIDYIYIMKRSSLENNFFLKRENKTRQRNQSTKINLFYMIELLESPL